VIPTDTPRPVSTLKLNFYITINPVGEHHVSDIFEINGTTNLPIDSKITVRIFSPYRQLAPEPNQNEILYPIRDLKGVAKITSGDQGRNTWSYEVNLSGFDTRAQYYAFIDGNLTEVDILPPQSDKLTAGRTNG